MAVDEDEERPTDVRWVQFMTPVFVRVQSVNDGWDTEIPKVIVVVDPMEMTLARDEDGKYLVYDDEFDQVDALEPLYSSGSASAVEMAQYRENWPKEELISTSDGWDIGPDPREDQGEYYLSAAEMDARFPDLVEDADDDE